MKKETRGSHQLVNWLRANGAQVTRIETRTQVGVPDINLASYYGEMWIETKQVKAQFDDFIHNRCKIRVKWEPGQLAWHADRVKAYPMRPVVLVVFLTDGLLFTRIMRTNIRMMSSPLQADCFDKCVASLHDLDGLKEVYDLGHHNYPYIKKQ
jgi:hypothetical protein